jgi:signal transduction histidine kinase
MRNACEAMADTAPSERVLAILVTCVNERTAANAPRRACVRFEFRDHGSGVPEALLDRLFNPFFTTRATGTGLGLAIVHRIIDAHDGALVIENASPGARVCMSFPLDPPQESLDTEGVSLDNAVRDRVQQYETTRSIR